MISTLNLNTRPVKKGREFNGDLRFNNGRIDQIGNGLAARDGETEVDAVSRRLLPGMIEDQVHFREPGMQYKADMAVEPAAAVAGGLTSLMDMPNTNPPTLDAVFRADQRHTPYTVQRSGVLSKCGWSPFRGMRFLSRIAAALAQRRAGVGRIRFGWQSCRARPAVGPMTFFGSSFPQKRTSMAGMTGIFLCTVAVFFASAQQRAETAMPPPPTLRDAVDVLGIVFPASVSQGAMVIGKVPAGSTVRYAGRILRITAYGSVVFGVGRDQSGPLLVSVQAPNAPTQDIRIAVTPRNWPIENINGVPPATVNPPKAIAERIQREQARVVAVRTRDDARTGFAQAFIWPVQGRISGRFGNQRVYNGTPKSPHSGMDIAAPTGTPVKAPADGTVTFVDPGLYLTGGTVVLDHGHGISSNFLHLSRIDAKAGDTIKQGDTIGAVGATGRATGPHLHWGMNWFDVRIDPLLVLDRK